jgi:hypothetical protein
MAEEKKRVSTKSGSKSASRTKPAAKQPAKSAKAARRRARSTTAASRQNSRPPLRRDNSGLSITVQIPSLRRPVKPADKPAVPFLRRFGRRRTVIAAVVIIAMAVIFGAPDLPSKQTDTAAVAAEKTQAEFKVLKPSAEQASATKYDAKRDLVTYTTTFSGARLTVSQQALPAQFSKEPTALQKTADTIHAKQRIDTVRGPLYVASNDKGSDQLALFAATDVLLMIHTDRTLDVPSWKAFIELLETK